MPCLKSSRSAGKLVQVFAPLVELRFQIVLAISSVCIRSVVTECVFNMYQSAACGARLVQPAAHD